VLSPRLIHAFSEAARSPDPDLAIAALMIARLEHPALDSSPYLDRLDAIGLEARRRVTAAPATLPDAPAAVDPARYARVMALNDYLFGELRFAGNEVSYEDPRNSFLNDVLDRRTGIPITLALVYMEVARRAGLPVEGVNFPGHFLLRCPADRALGDAQDLIIDAFHGGAVVSSEDMPFQDGPMRATKPQILTRMLRNLKHLYVRMHSYPQARDAVTLILAIDPSATTELRDRGLLSYNMRDFTSAQRDLQAYLERTPVSPLDTADRDERKKIREHLAELRKKAASLN
jgi:regulator of sirC expression with transglutaminase-like and TPR domain